MVSSVKNKNSGGTVALLNLPSCRMLGSTGPVWTEGRKFMGRTCFHHVSREEACKLLTRLQSRWETPLDHTLIAESRGAWLWRKKGTPLADSCTTGPTCLGCLLLAHQKHGAARVPLAKNVILNLVAARGFVVGPVALPRGTSALGP